MTPPEGIDNAWSFAAFVIFALVVGAPGLASYRASKKTDKKTDQVLESTAVTEKTLTEKNSGSHVKDQLDRIEEGQTVVLTEFEGIKEELNELKRRTDNVEHLVARKVRWWR